MTFAVKAKDLRERADVNFALGMVAVRQALAKAKYPLASVDSLTESIRYGNSSRGTMDPTGGVPIIRMNNIRDDAWVLDDLKYISEDEPDLEAVTLRPGDLVVNRTNTKDLVGKSAVWSKAGTWVFASYLVRARVDKSRVLPEFLAAVLNSPLGRVQIDRVSRQIAGMTNINLVELRSLQVPLPELAEQKKLVGALDRARDQRDEALREALVLMSRVAQVVPDLLKMPALDAKDDAAYAVSRIALTASKRLDPASFHPQRVLVRKALDDIAGCEAVRIGDVADLAGERVGTTEEVGYIGLADVVGGTGELAQKSEEESARSALRFQPGDVLYGRLRPRLNKVWRADRHGLCSTEFRVLRIKSDNVTPSYLALAMLSPWTLAQTVPLAAGNTHP